MKKLSFLALVLAILSCTNQTTRTKGSPEAAKAEVPVTTSADFAKKHTTFRDYWFRGLAEMNRYQTAKGRYNDLHDGETVLVFVTEPFLTDKQVKHESGDGANAVDVLKLNASERFYTGVYPYTILTSIFSPVSGDKTIKIMSNVQEWCGAAWVQLNANEDGYRARSFSYFQSEGDRDYQLPETAYEDTVFTSLRLDPAKLPIGEVQMVPAMTYLRLVHKETKPYRAVTSLQTEQKSPYWDAPVSVYRINYPDLAREVSIHFEPSFPYRIVAFDEKRPGIFGKEFTSVSTLTHSIMLDYWSKHDKADAPYRDALGLEF